MINKGNVVDFPETDAIEQEAALWLMRLEFGSLSSDEKSDYRAWLGRSPLHRKAMAQVSAVWGAADLLDQYNQIDPIEIEPVSRVRSARGIAVFGAVAASLVIALALVFVQLDLLAPATQTASVVTVVGEQKSIDLVDGSALILNTNSVAEVDIGRGARVVQLLRGEAHFDVAEDPDRPFRVYAGEGLVEAVGTAFTVHVREHDVEVIVSEGIVEVFSQTVRRDGSGTPIATEAEFRSLAALTANESATFNEEIEHRGKMDTAVLERKLMWRDGFLVFSGETLSEVVEEMVRYTDIEIEIGDEDLAMMPIAGSFEAGNVQGMFEALEKVFGIKPEKESETLVRLVPSI